MSISLYICISIYLFMYLYLYIYRYVYIYIDIYVGMCNASVSPPATSQAGTSPPAEHLSVSTKLGGSCWML